MLGLYSEVVVNKPPFVPMFFARFFAKHVGRKGLVVSAEKGKYSQEMMYGVLFDEDGTKTVDVACYFADQLTVHATPQ